MYCLCILCYLFLLIVKSISSHDIGDACNINDTTETGTCVLLKDCPTAIRGLTSDGRIPQLCGFQKTDPIVCCAGVVLTITPTFIEATKPPKIDSKSERRCKEYSKYSQKEVKPLLIDSSDTKVVPYCLLSSIPLIIGANEAPERYPHMALIGLETSDNETEWICSGSLISEDFVLTAAHCVNSRVASAKYIRLGDAREFNSNADFGRIQDFTILKSYIHPGYKHQSAYNDIALLQMSHKATLTDRIRPICLPTSNNLAENNADSTSWSRSDYDLSGRRHIVQRRVDYISEEACNNSYSNVIRRRLQNGILYDTQICTQMQFKSKDFCERTTGGPLQIFNKDAFCTYKLIGILSFGSTCGTDHLDVYTRVSAFTKWIEDIAFGTN